MNIVLIDLRKFNHPQLRTLCDTHKFNYDVLSGYKDNGHAKVWVDADSKEHTLFAFTNKKSNEMHATLSLRDFLCNMSSLEPVKKVRTLDLDSILEKISKYGMSSLKQDEVEFLENYNKS